MIRATFRLGVCRRHSERKDERKRGFKGSRYTRGTILRRDTVTERGRFEAITFSAVFLVFRAGFGAWKNPHLLSFSDVLLRCFGACRFSCGEIRLGWTRSEPWLDAFAGDVPVA